MSKTGRCLCGAVTYRASDFSKVGACHCSMCRRWSGGILFAAEPKETEWQGEDAIKVYASSDWAERGFCGTCGTNLFYRLRATGEHYLNPFTLDDTEGLEFTNEVFIDEKTPLFTLEGGEHRRQMTGEEVIAVFMAEQDAAGKEE